MKKRILMIEDEKNIVDILKFNLNKAGFDTLEAYDGAAGLELALRENPDLILLDLMLPKLNGFEVCEAIRKKNHAVPILMLTAKEDEDDKVKGLECGADDYITKPFSNREVIARINTNLRRTQVRPAPRPRPKKRDGKRISIDTGAMQIYKDGRALELSQLEYSLVSYMASQPGKVFSREALMEHVWKYEGGYVGDVRVVDVAVRRLREKIEDDPAQPEFVVTRRGRGYLFQA